MVAATLILLANFFQDFWEKFSEHLLLSYFFRICHVRIAGWRMKLAPSWQTQGHGSTRMYNRKSSFRAGSFGSSILPCSWGWSMIVANVEVPIIRGSQVYNQPMPGELAMLRTISTPHSKLESSRKISQNAYSPYSSFFYRSVDSQLLSQWKMQNLHMYRTSSKSVGTPRFNNIALLWPYRKGTLFYENQI
jgi:hypothetical protein